ncbi:MAG: hypothetical protein Q8Q14_12260 [Gemmatimonadales bacterium]|nr:hypothetical protein [Gemmatimonadales bacterium]
MSSSLGSRALRALGDRRFCGMTVACGETTAERWTLAVFGPRSDYCFWVDGMGFGCWGDDARVARALNPETGWLVLDAAALGGLLEAVRGVVPRLAWHRLAVRVTAWLVGQTTTEELCEDLVAALEAGREET